MRARSRWGESADASAECERTPLHGCPRTDPLRLPSPARKRSDPRGLHTEESPGATMCTDPVSAYTPDHLSRSPRFGLELARRSGPCSHPRPPCSKRFAETVESGPETALGGVDEAPSRCGGAELLRCECGAERELIACVVDRGVAGKILRHLGLPDKPPRMAPSRAPPVLGT